MSMTHFASVENSDELDELYAAWEEDRRSSHPTPLKEWIRRYPQHRAELIQWATMAPIMDYAETLPDDPEGEAHVRAIGHRIIEEARRKWRARQAATIAPPLRSLQATAQRVGLNPKALATRLGLGLTLLMKLEYRHLRLASIPDRLIRQLAEALQVSEQHIRAYLQQPPTLAPGASYRANQVPQVPAQEDFAHAVRSAPDMDEAQKASWLNQD
ncbi:MAG: hypothetical protein RMJ43_02770 [Chloroherpetonaceae bacterium]|nr:hypothetical protein [Chthonomonadaceae bacterium]MDW8206731.1 hypothetical protein [Chloroherpetonaceae bacterium]